jgi:hypothetical protein
MTHEAEAQETEESLFLLIKCKLKKWKDVIPYISSFMLPWRRMVRSLVSI